MVGVKEPLAKVDELYLEGLALKREQIRRDDPSLSDDDVEDRLRAWLRDRPFDGPGRVRAL